MSITTHQTQWTPDVYHAGYRVASGRNQVYSAGRVTTPDGEAIPFRWTGPHYDARDLDLHASPDSPRGDLRTQIADVLRRSGISAVEFCNPDDPHAGRA